MLYLTQIGVDSSYAGEVLPALIVFGAGLGLVFSTSLSNATLGVEPTDSGVASATVNASQQIGGSLGVALLSTIAAAASADYLARARHVPNLVGHAAVHGYAVGFGWLAGIFAVSAVVCAALFTRRVRGREVNDEGPGIRHRVVVIGGGFGGLEAAMKLARLPVDVTLIDRRNFHFFQPLAYQVATGVLSAAEISYPLRRIFRRRDNVRVLLAEATDIDLEAQQLRVRPVDGDHECDSVAFDTLIVAAGSRYNYFHHDRWQQVAPDLKTPESALEIRARLLRAFEAGVLAERAGLEADRAGRVEVLGDLSLPGHPNVLAIGDMIRIRQAEGFSIVLPGLAPVAMQEGRHAARVVRDRLHGRPGRRLPLPRQGQPRHHRTRKGRRRGQAHSSQRLSGMDHLADGSPLVPGRVREPASRRDALGLQLHRPPTRRPRHHKYSNAIDYGRSRFGRVLPAKSPQRNVEGEEAA